MKAKGNRHRRHRPNFHRRTAPGAPPGVLVPDPTAPETRIEVMAYGPEGFAEAQIKSVSEIPVYLAKWPVTWINVEGLGDVTVVRELGQLFGLHALALEDVVHVHQRAKAESYGDHYFIVSRMPIPGQDCETEQISMFLKDRVVLTFQEKIGGDCLDSIRARIRSGWGRGRASHSDYLVYALLDGIVDQYFPLVERCGEQLDELEDEVGVTTQGMMPRIHSIKRKLLTVRRIAWPLRDAINILLRDQTPLMSDETRVYLRDVYDHTIQIIDLVESYRDISSGIAEIHLASINQRTNEIMRVLTIISTIFIPLTFIVGVYGMNFDKEAGAWSMPELYTKWGYPIVWGVMIAIAGVMLLFFRKKGWLGRSEAESLSKNDSRPY